MITRRLLLRQVRRLLSPLPPTWTRLLATEAFNIPNVSDPTAFQQLVKAGAINENVAKYLDRQRERDQSLGETEPYKSPLPTSVSKVTLNMLLACQSHLGHSTSSWNPANAKYIFGIRNGVHIISLDQTAAHLRRAAKVVKAVSSRAGIMLFVGSRKGQEKSVVEAAARANAYHLFDRYIPGSFTNGQHILGHGELAVIDQLDRQLEGFQEQLREQSSIIPDLVICLNPQENRALLRECALLNIPTIGVIDTDTNPSYVTYQIPANDDSIRCTNLIAHVLGIAAEEGKNERLDLAKKGEIPFNVSHSLLMPEEYEELQQTDDNLDIVDLREESGLASVKFANSEDAKK